MRGTKSLLELIDVGEPLCEDGQILGERAGYGSDTYGHHDPCPEEEGNACHRERASRWYTTTVLLRFTQRPSEVVVYTSMLNSTFISNHDTCGASNDH